MSGAEASPSATPVEARLLLLVPLEDRLCHHHHAVAAPASTTTPATTPPATAPTLMPPPPPLLGGVVGAGCHVTSVAMGVMGLQSPADGVAEAPRNTTGRPVAGKKIT
jgi:hypothetical protein